MFPNRWLGKTKWSQGKTSPLCSMTRLSPQVSEKAQNEAGSPYHLSNVTSNICTKILPTSDFTHSSKTSVINLPKHSAETDHEATVVCRIIPTTVSRASEIGRCSKTGMN